MQYHSTEQVNRQRWEQDQQAVIDELRQRVQHDLAAQNPGSTVTIDSLHPTIHSRNAATEAEGAETYLVDVMVEYTISGQANTFAA